MTQPPEAPGQPPRPDAIAAAVQLAGTVRALGGKVDNLSKRMGTSEADRARLHKISRRTIGGLVLDIALSLFVIFGGVTVIDQGASISSLQQTNHRLDSAIAQLHATATQFHASVVGSCEAFNTRLRQDKSVWDYIIGQSKPPPSATAAQRRTEERVLTHLRYLVDSKDAPRDCAALFSTRRAK